MQKVSNKLHSKDKKPLVSICVITYNHEQFIEEALESFLMQEINFEVEIVLHDDASTDSTQDIVKTYVNQYPGLFNVLLQTENQRSKYGGGMQPRFNYPRTKGKYIALCDGDDYWTDALKLQKQVDIMEENDEISLVHGKAEIIRLDKSQEEINKFSVKIPRLKSKATKSLLSFNYYVRTGSAMFKRNDVENFFKVYDENNLMNIANGDILLWYILSKKGSFYYFDDTLIVYRVLVESASNTKSINKKREMLIRYILTRIILAKKEKYYSLMLKLLPKLLKQKILLFLKYQ